MRGSGVLHAVRDPTPDSSAPQTPLGKSGGEEEPVPYAG